MNYEQTSHKRKKQMAQALKKLMLQKSLNKITIQEISAECGISRYTFYYHFKDIYELLLWMFQENTLSLIQVSENCLTWEEGFQLVLKNIEENRQVFKCTLDSLADEALRKMFYQEIHHIMRLFLSDIRGQYQVSEKYQDFLGDFYTCALSGVLIDWIRQDIDFTENTILKYFHPLMSGEAIRVAFQQAETDGL